MSEIAKWTIASVDRDAVDRLVDKLSIDSVIATCLVNRNIVDPVEAKTFLEPLLKDLDDPKPMSDLSTAAKRLARAVTCHERVAIFGDYDVDGVSSVAVIENLFRMLGIETQTMVADRFSGYGMGPQAINLFVEKGCTLVVALDCGTSDHKAAKCAKEANIDLVVVDHHRVEGEHPDVHAFVNPQRSDCKFADKTLAAVGLAFYLAAAVRTELVEQGYIKREDINLKNMLDLVALGTVADVMPLRGNNRIMTFHGMRQISWNPREGINALIRIARIRSQKIRTDHIAYQLAPRLNASGRISHAKESLALLVSNNRLESEQLANNLDQLSQNRRVLEKQVLDDAKMAIEKEGLANDKVIVVAGEGWHRGVLGIVASRLVELTRRPVYVIGIDGDSGTASARGPGQVNLHQSLVYSSEFLLRYGGHREAAGFSINRDKVDDLRRCLIEYAQKNWVDIKVGGIVCDYVLNPGDLSAKIVTELERLGPFGSGNPEPVFEVDGLWVLDKRIVGQEHLKLKLKTPSGYISAFGPRMGQHLAQIQPLIKVAATLAVDEWRGDGFPELRLKAPPIPGS